MSALHGRTLERPPPTPRNTMSKLLKAQAQARQLPPEPAGDYPTPLTLLSAALYRLPATWRRPVSSACIRFGSVLRWKGFEVPSNQVTCFTKALLNLPLPPHPPFLVMILVISMSKKVLKFSVT